MLSRPPYLAGAIWLGLFLVMLGTIFRVVPAHSRSVLLSIADAPKAVPTRLGLHWVGLARQSRTPPLQPPRLPTGPATTPETPQPAQTSPWPVTPAWLAATAFVAGFGAAWRRTSGPAGAGSVPPPPPATPGWGRREALAASAASVSLAVSPGTEAADVPAQPRIMVVGATGQTGRLCVEALRGKGQTVLAGARDVGRAAALGVPAVRLDVTGRFDDLVAALRGVDVVVCCVGFSASNPFEFGQAAHAVDNVGTVALIDAAQAAGVRRFVLMSSILTNGRAVGQARSPGFLITNALGGVLDEKLAAERHLPASTLDWAIVRPGGLEGRTPVGPIAFAAEDTVFSGTVTRSNVAQVLAMAAISPAASLRRVVEVVELGSCLPGLCPPNLAPAPDCLGRWFPDDPTLLVANACPR